MKYAFGPSAKALSAEAKYELAASRLESSESRCKHCESVVKAKRLVYLKLIEKNQNRSVKYILYSANRAAHAHEVWSFTFQSAALTTAATHSPAVPSRQQKNMQTNTRLIPAKQHPFCASEQTFASAECSLQPSAAAENKPLLS
jgi:hypothetical protein